MEVTPFSLFVVVVVVAVVVVVVVVVLNDLELYNQKSYMKLDGKR